MIDRLADPNSSARRLLIIATVWISLLIIAAVGILSTFHPKTGLLQLPTNPAVSATPGHAPPSPAPNPVAVPAGTGGSSANKGTLPGSGNPPGDVEDEPSGSSCVCSQVPRPGSVNSPLPVPTQLLPSLSPLPKVP